jgi:hypothetical protein
MHHLTVFRKCCLALQQFPPLIGILSTLRKEQTYAWSDSLASDRYQSVIEWVCSRSKIHSWSCGNILCVWIIQWAHPMSCACSVLPPLFC